MTVGVLMTDKKTGLPTSDTAFSEWLSSVFKHLDVAAVVADSGRRIVMMNHAAEALFGYTLPELYGKPTRVLYDDPAAFEKQGRTRFNPTATQSDQPELVRYRHKNGLTFDGETMGGPVKAETGNLFFVGLIKDISRSRLTVKTLSRLHSITSSRELNFEERVNAILELGAQHFELPIGIFSRIQGDIYTVIQAVDPDNALSPGQTFNFSDTYCNHVFGQQDVRGFHYVANSEIRAHPCYRNFQLEAYLGSTIFVDGERYGTLNFSSPSPTRPFTDEDIELVRLFAEWIGHELARKRDIDALEQAHSQLEHQARTDVLTGLVNRRYAEQNLQQQLQQAQRYDRPLAVALLDFDHFKALNDSQGHSAGDQVLVRFSETARQVSRQSDVFARWGGEEFLAILPETDEAGAVMLLERLCAKMKNTDVNPNGTPVTLTLSIGIAMLHPDDTIETLVRRADEAMYQAKDEGRDRIHVATDPAA